MEKQCQPPPLLRTWSVTVTQNRFSLNSPLLPPKLAVSFLPALPSLIQFSFPRLTSIPNPQAGLLPLLLCHLLLPENSPGRILFWAAAFLQVSFQGLIPQGSCPRPRPWRTSACAHSMTNSRTRAYMWQFSWAGTGGMHWPSTGPQVSSFRGSRSAALSENHHPSEYHSSPKGSHH